MNPNKNLYTFLLDYKGGTYIKQIKALTVEEAFDIWLEFLDYSLIKGFGNRSYIKICSLWKEQRELIPIKETKHVWCFADSIRGDLFLVNIVKTVY